MKIAFDRSFFVGLLLLVSQGGASLSEASPDSMDRWNRYTKLGPFFSASSFDHNFQPNDNQTFIVYEKSTLVLYRKGLCGFFFQFQNSPRKSFDLERSVATISDQREYDAIKLKMESMSEYKGFKKGDKAILDKHKKVKNPPKGYHRIKVHLVFAVKFDGRHKARLVADGHLTPEPIENIYSGVV